VTRTVSVVGGQKKKEKKRLNKKGKGSRGYEKEEKRRRIKALSPSSVTGEPRIDIDSPSENEATDERPSDAFIRWNVSEITANQRRLSNSQ